MDSDKVDIIPTLKALSDESRFRIINLLLMHDLCVGALAGQLNISRAAVSQHLRILRKAGLVSGEKRGYWTHYSVDKRVIYQIADDLIKLSNQAPDLRNACNRSLTDEVKTDDKKRREFHMCKNCCQQLEQLKGKPEECTPEQIKACHGDEKKHPCAPKKEKN